MNNARQTGAVLEAHFQFMQWLFPAIARFPRSVASHHCEPERSPVRHQHLVRLSVGNRYVTIMAVKVVEYLGEDGSSSPSTAGSLS